MQNLHDAQASLLARRPQRNTLKPLASILPQAAHALSADEPQPERTASLARLDELDPTWHPMVQQAIDTARRWQQRRREQVASGQPANASLILVATAVPDDVNRTGYGCGKTHVARACLWSVAYLVDAQPIAPVGQFFLAEDIINRLDGETPASQELPGEPPIVVIDDVGAEGLIPFTRQDENSQTIERHARYFRLVDYCYTTGISLIITGNLTLHALANHVGGRAWSRLLQMAPAGFMLDMSGVPDYRRQQGGR